MIGDRKTRKEAVADASVQIVTFRVGAESFGLDITSLTEVIRPLPVTALPHMPKFVQGVINLRGVIIPVVDLRERLGVPGTRDNPKTARMLITRGALAAGGTARSRLLGLVVDSVQDVLGVPARHIESAPESAAGAGADVIAGVAKVSDRLIILLDLAKVLSREERAALAEAGHVDA